MHYQASLHVLLVAAAAATLASAADPRLAGSERSAPRAGWIAVRLTGTPEQIGFQHGYLLAHEIEDGLAAMRLGMIHDSGHDWAFYRETARRLFWPKVTDEYQREITGMAKGLAAAGVKLDYLDLVALNASEEVGYYTAWLDKTKTPTAPDRCSAFVATGSYTKDGQVVIAHNNWSGYLEASRWNIIFDIRPVKGQRILMDGYPGLIHSGDDFGLNSAGIAITETTITQFHGFDPKGVPEFVRARQAMQYATSIDEFVSFMKTGNNGGYANAWLVADVNRNEIARLELGLKHVTLERSKDGYFVGANFPINPELIKEETDFPIGDPAVSANARHTRWEQLMSQFKGKIDVAAGKAFLTDHYDVIDKRDNAPSERTLCGHIDLSPRGLKPWQEVHGPAGVAQSKIADAAMVKAMALEAAMGHACGIGFSAAEHLKKHPEFNWMKPVLKDIPVQPWTRFEANPSRERK
jgi:hypothetical protein